MLTSQSFILYNQNHYSSQLLNYICLEDEELSAANMSNKNKRKISETREESEEIPVKKQRASGKCSTCKIHDVDALGGDGHKHVCQFKDCCCTKCIANTRRKDKSANDIRLTRTKKIFDDKKRKKTESNQRQIENTLSEEQKNPSWQDIKTNLEKEKEGDYYDHQEFLKNLYSVLVQANVIDQSSFAMRVIKTCFEILTAAIEDRKIPKKVANKAYQNLRDCIQKMSNEEFQQQQLQQQQHQLQQQQQQQQQLQQHQLPPPLLQHQQLQYSHWYNFLLDPRFLRSPTTYNYTCLKKEFPQNSPPEEFTNILLNQVRSSVPYKSLEFSSKYHWGGNARWKRKDPRDTYSGRR